MAAGNRILARGSWSETARISEILRKETVGGALLLLATVVALVWANSPWAASYEALRNVRVGPAALHLDLTLGTWAADGLLAIFFFIVGLELKREFIAGDLRDPRTAALPIAAAFGGIAVPALIFVAVNLSTGGDALRGWAIPTATDIAFALAVLAVIGGYLPNALRIFLLTLAVVDDLVAVAIIAIFYTAEVHLLPLLLALIPLAIFGFLVHKRVRSWWLLIPLALITWTLMHSSGVHATVAGVLLGLLVPVWRRDGGEGPGLAEHFEHRFRPLSTGLAVPVFAFFAAGVAIGGLSGLTEALSDPIALGIVLGLVFGKPIGITLTTWLLARFTKAELDDDLAWVDVIGVAGLAGIGFTVSLLIGDLAYGSGSERDSIVKVAILTGSVLASIGAGALLVSRNRAYKRIHDYETLDVDGDGVPDVYDSDWERRRG